MEFPRAAPSGIPQTSLGFRGHLITNFPHIMVLLIINIRCQFLKLINNTSFNTTIRNRGKYENEPKMNWFPLNSLHTSLARLNNSHLLSESYFSELYLQEVLVVFY